MHSLIIFGAKYLFVAVVLIWLFVWWQASPRNKKQLIWVSVVAVVIAAIIDKVSAKLYYDPRPFVTHHIQPLVAHTADNGFPSDHTLFSATLATVVFFYRPKWGILAGVIALLVGSARVAAHVHSPIDIAGGVIFGLIAGYIGYLATTKLLKDGGSHRAKPGAGRPANPTRTR